MKSELRLKPHHLLPGEQVAEVWYNGELIATVTGADGPGIRVISKHFPLDPAIHRKRIDDGLPNVVQVMLEVVGKSRNPCQDCE